jgi:hypothetical protein
MLQPQKLTCGLSHGLIPSQQLFAFCFNENTRKTVANLKHDIQKLEGVPIEQGKKTETAETMGITNG